MNTQQHEELKSLLGAFALNATEDLERRRVERHLSTCDDCANEVRLLREVTTELAWLTEPSEDAGDLVDRIVVALPARRRRVSTWITTGIAAVSVVAAGVLGGVLVSERARNDRFADVVANADKQIRLGAQNGFAGHGILHLADGKAALVLEDLPDAGSGRSYQLWAIAGAKPRSFAVIDGKDRVVHLFDYEGAADRFAITVEPSGGSPVPTSDPVLVGA